MHGARDEFLARAILAVDQHAAVGRRGRLDLLAQLPHRQALAHHDELTIDPRPQRPVLGLEVALSQRVAHDEHRLLERQRLLDEVEGAHLDRPDRRLDVAMARDHHDLRVHFALAQALQRDEAIDTRQPDVEHDDVIRRAGRPIEALFPARGRLDVEPLVAEHAAQRRTDARLVIDNQNGCHEDSLVRRHTGNSIVNRVPRGRFAATSMVPPCSTTMRRTMARPRPLPRPLVE